MVVPPFTSVSGRFWIRGGIMFSVPGFLAASCSPVEEEVSLASKVSIHMVSANHCSRLAAHSSAEPSLHLWCLLHRSPETGVLPVWQEPS